MSNVYLGLALFFAVKLSNDHVALHKFMYPARDATSNVTRARYPGDTLRDILAEYDQGPEKDAKKTWR